MVGAVVLLAACLAPQSEAGVPVNMLKVIAGAGLVVRDTLASLATLNDEGVVALDEEEHHAEASLADVGAADELWRLKNGKDHG